KTLLRGVALFHQDAAVRHLLRAQREYSNSGKEKQSHREAFCPDASTPRGRAPCGKMLSNMKLAAVLPLSLVSMLVSLAVAADTIPSSAAKDHINETATV